jgi:hypothetical protein
MHTDVDAGVASVCCEDAQATEGLLATTANKKDPVSSIPPQLAQLEPNKLSFPTWNYMS